jgi:hypothetical protein
MNLLIVEDDQNQLQMYNDVIESFSKQEKIEIKRDCFTTINNGLDAIKSPIYDAAIIDLKLSSDTAKLEGMDLVNAINGKLRIPIYIVSGSIAQVDIVENSLFKKKLRTDSFKEILAEIKNIYDTGITKYLIQGGQIDEMLSSIFWKHLSKDLDIWIQHKNPSTLLRYILSHFQEHLDINLHGDFEDYHPSEVYIKPPIKKNIHTGDLVKFNGTFYLILTPACDIIIQNYKELPDGSKEAIRKAENLILVKAKEFDYKNLCKDKSGNIDKGKIKNFITNNSFRLHYLPPFEKNNGFLVDFQDITSMDLTSHLERIATVSSPFIKDIISRFSSYYSRQGQPTFCQDKIVDDLFSKK